MGTPGPRPFPSDDPAAVAPPEGLDLPPVVTPPVVAPAAPGKGALDGVAVRRTLLPYLEDADLGRHVLAEVAPLAGGEPTFVRGTDTAVPASTTKLVTTTAALLALGPDHVFETQVRAGGGNRLVLVGGGDPYLERGPADDDGSPWPYPQRADLATLADATAAALRANDVTRVRLSYDDSLFAGPAENPTWEDDYLSDSVVSPTTALWVDQGRRVGSFVRVEDPGAEAGRTFAEALAAAGITVAGPVTEAVVSGDAPVVATVSSPPLSQIVERIVEVSDNEAAEVLLRQVGLATGGDGSIESGQDGVRALLRKAGVRFGGSVFYDGSGLSRANRADPDLLVQVLQLAASPDHPALRAVVEGLPVAAFSGSLTDRMFEGPAAGRGRVRAKTGTLSNVRSLAGLATDQDGTVMVFVLMADRARDSLDDAAGVVLDNAAAALGACACSG